MYCATYILHWALHREEPWCPQCKQPFDTLLTYRTLDGQLQVSDRGSWWPALQPVRMFSMKGGAAELGQGLCRAGTHASGPWQAPSRWSAHPLSAVPRLRPPAPAGLPL